MLEIVVGIDYVPLRSVGVDFEVHMSNTPADLNDQIIGIGHLISNSSEHWSARSIMRKQDAGVFNAKMATPSSADEVDADELADAITGRVGHFGDHVDALNLTRTILMDDPDDGTVNVVVPSTGFIRLVAMTFLVFVKPSYLM